MSNDDPKRARVRLNLDAGIASPKNEIITVPKPLARLKTFYNNFSAWARWLTGSTTYRNTLLLTITINLIFTAINTSQDINQEYGFVFEGIDIAFLVVYTSEFLLKLIAAPRGYWSSNYNIFDLVILAFSYAQLVVPDSAQNSILIRLFSAIRSLRALRFISLFSQLQILVGALVKTIGSIFYVITLLLVMLFVGSVLGYQLYGGNPDPSNPFSSVPLAMYNLFDFLTADSWTDTQDNMDLLFGETSRIYTSIFVFLGHFMYENLLAGLIIQFLTEADEREKAAIRKKKIEAVEKKKQFILERQKQDMAALMETQQQIMKDAPQQSFAQILGRLAGKLNHNIIVPSSDLACNQTWLELFMATLEHQVHTMYRTQQLHFEMSNAMAEVLERRLRSKVDKT
eukprot:TRINITY_DN16259_c0_g1_i2.p1 TRINITY_DN16259_c0_g1~~TRINITY_DN16259_c0_g1_i2.p1  ORF type:complete len:443 (+),score=101.69 TRINITY_DN16259_c0_g1_i2:133-1329(+)